MAVVVVAAVRNSRAVDCRSGGRGRRSQSLLIYLEKRIDSRLSWELVGLAVAVLIGASFFLN